MRGRYRKIDNEVLQNPRWERLTPYARLLKLVCDVSPRQTACGVLRASRAALVLETGLTNRQISKAIDELAAVDFIEKLAEDAFWVPTFFKSNCSSDKFAAAALKEIRTEWPQIEERFLAVNRDIDALRKALAQEKYGSPTAVEPQSKDSSTPSVAVTASETESAFRGAGVQTPPAPTGSGSDSGSGRAGGGDGAGGFDAPPPAAPAAIPSKENGSENPAANEGRDLSWLREAKVAEVAREIREGASEEAIASKLKLFGLRRWEVEAILEKTDG